MLGFLIGTACLFGLVRMLRRSHGWGHWHHGPWAYSGGCGGARYRSWDGGGGPYRGRRGWTDDMDDDDFGPFYAHARRGPGFFGLGAILDRLEVTPAQERAIRAAFDELREKGRAVKDDARGMRRDLASAFRAESLDAETLGTVASRVSGAVDGVRDAAIGAVLKVHDTLDERQRRIVADLVESGSGFGRRWGR